MTKEVTNYNELAEFDVTSKKLLDDFSKKLNKKPSDAALKKHPMGNFKYIPIEILEMALDSIYGGLWSIENTNVQVLVNAVVVNLDLKVFHPVTRTWITRSGVGSVPVEISRKDGNPNAMALQKNAPAAKAFAFKNACSSLGKRFGRDVNRGVDIPFFEDSSNFEGLINA